MIKEHLKGDDDMAISSSKKIKAATSPLGLGSSSNHDGGIVT